MQTILSKEMLLLGNIQIWDGEKQELYTEKRNKNVSTWGVTFIYR